MMKRPFRLPGKTPLLGYQVCQPRKDQQCESKDDSAHVSRRP